MSDIVETIYPYETDQGHGLSFAAGVKISVVERGENGWWKGSLLNNNTNDGKHEVEGWFPASYVEEFIEKNHEMEQTMTPVKVPQSPLPPNWKATQAGDGQTYYYNEISHETSWSFPQNSSPIKTPPVTYPKRHTISQCSNIRKNSPLQMVKDEHFSSEPRSSSGLSVITDSGYDGSLGTPSPSSSRESVDGKSVGSTGSGGNRRRRAKQMALDLTPSRPQFLNYPSISESKEQNLLNQLEVSFCDHFWDDLGESTGFDIVKAFVSKGKSNCKEMADFFRERAAIEDVYARNLARLAHSSHGNQEKGSCGETWQRVKKGVEEESKTHQKFSHSLLQGLYKTLTEFAERPVLQDKKDSKRIDIVIQEERKRVASKFKEVEKQHGILAERQAKINQVNKQQDVVKTQKKIASSADDLKRCIDDFNDAQRTWIDDMVLGLLELEKRETERIEFLKKKLDLYTEMAKTTYVEKTEGTLKTFNQIEKISAVMDRKAFVDGSRTGSIRPVDRKK